ncbi:MAG: rod shape-determining protein MreD [Clostridia bacterium]|nr:rod shape-determining protein MreD [Clostridia bacterium]
MKKILVGLLTIIVLLLFLWLQINVFNYFALFGVIPNIGIILIVAISMYAGKNIGAVTGFIYGLVFDSCFEISFGLYTLLFLLMGYAIGQIKGKFALDNKFSLPIIVAVTTIIVEIINLIFLNLKQPAFDISFLYVTKVLLLESAYNVLLTLLAYKPLMLLGDIINRSRRAYYEL